MSNIRRGEIYLTNFGKKYNSEFGKIRPALIIQNDIANRNLDLVVFKGVTVIPLSTNLSGGGIRTLIQKREALEHDSEICINELCTLDLSRIDETQKCTALTTKELEEVEMKLKRHLGL